jgi:hypothetical protein
MIEGIVVAMALLAGSAGAVDATAHRADVEAWRAWRVGRLQQPDGWLSLVGLHWIEPGTHTVGSGKGNGIVLNVGPERLGTLTHRDGTIRFALADGVDAAIEGVEARESDLADDKSGKPTFVRFGSANFHVIERGGRHALRVKDAEAETRRNFAGIDYFGIDPSWRIEARYERHAPGKTIPIADVIGTLEDTPNLGAAVFERDGRTFRLEAIDGGPGQVWFILADRTSGKTTYGAGRFLYADLPAEGSDTIVVDFNKAYNPPCVFTPHATCPLAPPENRLDLAVTAGEKRYKLEAH